MGLDRTIKTILGVGAIVTMAGCAKTCDNIDAKGGVFGSYRAPYIVISQSGGKIMDVYKLPNAIVQSEEGLDGWLFKDQSGNPIYLGETNPGLLFTID